MKILMIALLAILVLVMGVLAYKYTYNGVPGFLEQDKKEQKKGKKKDKKEEEDPTTNRNISILQRWSMPDVLTEVSDICNIDDNSFACVQDEIGRIFIYNLQSKKIEREIDFAKRGDYEGIAIVGEIAYVANSSGTIFEVNYNSEAKPMVKEYKTDLGPKDEVEALCYDKDNNRLLLAFKRDEGTAGKGIYSFSLADKQLSKNPVYTINISDAAAEGKKKKNNLRPSAMAINPVSGDIYLTEGTDPKLVILDRQGKLKSVSQLGRSDFEQPEGITFNSSGEMFISNEGNKGYGNILQVKL